MNETTATLEITRKPAAPSLRKRRETTAMLAGHRFHILTDEQLHFVLRDAREAADNTRGMDYAAECKYLDQTPGIVVKPAVIAGVLGPFLTLYMGANGRGRGTRAVLEGMREVRPLAGFHVSRIGHTVLC